MKALLANSGEHTGRRPDARSTTLGKCTANNCRILGALLFAAGFAGRTPAALTVAPATLANDYKGEVTLTITGLNNAGQRVVVEKFLDADNSNSITAADVLMLRFKVTDGQVTNVAGRRNINVPGDDSATASVIQTKLYFTPGEIPARIDGRFIFRVSPDGAGFTPFTGTLTVTQKDYGGSGISGRVMAGAAPQAGALVMITSGAQDDFDVAGVTKTDAAGNYSLKLPAGYYRPVPVKPGFVFNLGSSSALSVTAGSMTAAGDAVLTPGTRTISGLVRDDAATAVTLGGMLAFAFGDSGTFTFTFSDASGNYVLDALAGGATEVGVLETQCATMGVIQLSTHEESGAGNVTGFHLTLPRPTSLIYGTARTPGGAPVPWLDVYGELGDVNELQSYSATDASGNFTLGVTAGTWDVEAESPDGLSSGAEVPVGAGGSAVLHDITVHPVTAHLRGIVRDNNNQVVPNVEIFAHDFAGANSWGYTDAAGHFDLGVFGGTGGAAKTWAIQLNQNSEDEPATHISSQAQFEVTDGNDINNITYLAYLITAHFRGTVLDENSTPLGGGNLYASLQSGSAISGSNIGGDGSFDIPVFAGTWRVGLSGPPPAGFLVQDEPLLAATDGSDQNGLIFRLRRTTGSISGTLKDTTGAGLNNVRVTATTTIAGASFTSSIFTGGGGNFSMPVFAATWNVNVDGTALFNLGYQPVPAQQVIFTSGNVTVNFTATADGASTFTSWQSQNFTPAELANPAISGPNADPERDGASNFLEYSLNLAPKLPDANGLPFPGRQAGAPGGADYLTLTFRRRIGAQGLAYNVIEAPTLTGPWNNVTSGYEILSSDGTMETVRARTLITPGTPQFMRLQVLQQP
jgi:hypothetical protein